MKRHLLALITALLDWYEAHSTWEAQPPARREHPMPSRRVVVLRELAVENERAKGEQRRGVTGTRGPRYAKHHEKINYLLTELELAALDFEPVIEAPLVRTDQPWSTA